MANNTCSYPVKRRHVRRSVGQVYTIWQNAEYTKLNGNGLDINNTIKSSTELSSKLMFCNYSQYDNDSKKGQTFIKISS